MVRGLVLAAASAGKVPPGVHESPIPPEVTEAINSLYDLALKENDHITSSFLHWFIKEQMEEVSLMTDLLKTVERAGEGGLLLVEQFLAQGTMGSSLGSEFAAESGPEA